MTSSSQDSSTTTASIDPQNTPQTGSALPEGADAISTLPRLEPVLTVDPSLRANPRFHVFQLHSASADFDREITVYLPEAYRQDPDRRFPVLYLHDGQNLLDDETAYLPGHTWRCHTTADATIAAGTVEPLILVGIANAGIRRMPEYTPTPDPNFGGGGGPRYGDLLLHELKPLIDRTWRTLPGPAHTGLGGSSLGGLISLYLALEHRDVFSRIAVVSPSLWWDNRSILRLVRRASPEPNLRIWLDMGTAEGARHLHDTDQLYGILLDRGWIPGEQLLYQRIPGGLHNEDAWASRFGDILRFLYPSSPTPSSASNASNQSADPCNL